MKKLGVLIGVDKYSFLNNLQYAEADARSVSESLQTNYGFSTDEILLMVGQDGCATQRFIEKKLGQLRDFYQDLELLLIGFWGHGFLSPTGNRYLCAMDTDRDDLERTGLSFESIRSLLVQIQARNTCLIMDCCQSLLSRGEENAFTDQDYETMSTAARSAQRDITVGLKKQGKSVTIAPTFAILNSCSPGQQAYEWEERQHGLFTAHLLDGMAKRVSHLGSLAHYVSKNVAKTSQMQFRSQTPFLKLEGSGDILFPVVDEEPQYPVFTKTPIDHDPPKNVNNPESKAQKITVKNFSKTPFETTAAWKKRLEGYPRIQIGYGEFQADACNADKNLFPIRFFVEDLYKKHIKGFKDVIDFTIPVKVAEAIYSQTPHIPLTGTFTVNDSDWSVTNLLFESGENQVDVEAARIRALREAGQGIVAGEQRIETIKGKKYAFRWCPAGTFMMGSPESEWDRAEIKWKGYDETQHEVTLTKGFWMLETPVTQELWQSVMGNNPSYFKGNNLPVETVSWNDCQEFIGELNAILKGNLKCRLPSEAEWEYACRAGTTGAYGGMGNLDEMGWYDTNSGEKTHPVKSKKPNDWEIYDMHGNVCEWCQDWFDEDYYACSPSKDPTGPDSGSYRVCRGGGWDGSTEHCRSACRFYTYPKNMDNDLGFRLVLSPTD